MATSLSRYLLLLSAEAAVNLLWWLDVLTGTNLTRLKRFAKFSFLYTTSAAYFAFMIFTFKTGYLATVADGVRISIQGYPDIYENSTPSYVLGIKSDRSFPVKVNQDTTPAITAKSALVVDRKNSKVLYELNDSAELAPASTTKLMTALVALDLYKLDDVLTVSQECTAIDSTKAWLWKDAQFKVKDLLYTMLIDSAGDAACVLSTGKVSTDEFVSLMNRKAVSLGMTSTHFSNVIGLDGVDGNHYSTAKDLYDLASKAMDNNLIKDIVKTKTFEIKSTDAKFVSTIYNTNKLLEEIPQSVGIKTGTTAGAGEVLIYAYKDSDKDLFIIVMGSQDRFADTKVLLSWVLNSFSWKK
jgi:serine-type D-Ala-D-Ala carboxypeptidase (penicillin-binding protein 5/6)